MNVLRSDNGFSYNRDEKVFKKFTVRLLIETDCFSADHVMMHTLLVSTLLSFRVE